MKYLIMFSNLVSVFLSNMFARMLPRSKNGALTCALLTHFDVKTIARDL